MPACRKKSTRPGQPQDAFRGPRATVRETPAVVLTLHRPPRTSEGAVRAPHCKWLTDHSAPWAARQLRLAYCVLQSKHGRDLPPDQRRDRVLRGFHLGSAVLTSARSPACELPVLWRQGSSPRVVWARRLFMGLGASSGLDWTTAAGQLRQLGARQCTAEERRLLLSLPPVPRGHVDTRVITIDAACQWLRSIGQPEAATQLSQHQLPASQSGPPDVLSQDAVRAAAGVHSCRNAAGPNAAASQTDGAGSQTHTSSCRCDRKCGPGYILERRGNASVIY